MDLKRKALIGAGAGVVGPLALATAALATPPTPAEAAVDVTDAGFAALIPVATAVATAGLPLLVLVMGIRWGYSIVKSKGQSV